MHQLQSLLLISSIIAIGAFTLSNILTLPEHIFGSLDGWMDRNLPEWLYKPLLGCQYCIAGQWALWYYLALAFLTNEVSYRIDVHILFILLTVFLAEPITYLYYRIFKKS